MRLYLVLSIQNTFGVSLLVSVGAFFACCGAATLLEEEHPTVGRRRCASFAWTLVDGLGQYSGSSVSGERWRRPAVLIRIVVAVRR